jgi:NADPH:quinone reductase-like Zn-dependent oxidoreductase
MRQVTINDRGIAGLAVTEAPDPTPGPYEALIRMHSTSLNYRDLLTVQTAGAHQPGLVPNSCGAGTVIATGAGVTRVAEGDRVAPMFFQKWFAGPPTEAGLASALGGSIDGCLRDLMVLHEDGITKIPDYMTFEEAATLPCAALTAWRGLMEEGRLRAGETVLVQGTGGVSVFALQFAKMAGAEVILTSSSDDKLERGKALGADHTINYRTTPEWGAEVRGITGGHGADHIVEVGGANTLQQSIASVALYGHIHVIGVLGGFVNDVNVPALFRANARIHGITVGSRTMFENMIRAMALHEMHPVIDRTFPMDQVQDAFTLMEQGGHFGKIVINF